MMRFLLLFSLLLLSACNNSHQSLAIDEPLPSITVQNAQGQTVKLPDDFKGKVLLIKFWSLDCHFCDKNSFFALDKLYQKYKTAGFIPLSIHEGKNANDERLKQFQALSYPLLHDEYNAAAKRLGLISLPTTFIVDRDGRVRKKISGEAKMEELEVFFTTILNKGGSNENAH
ncbi:glutathione peroxidase [Patescibacteria group bacterium]|nr:glutathione peroxidase [Patescibacteria group bacterium]